MARVHRTGLVGTGSIAAHHVAALRKIPGVEIVGVTDLDADRARAFAEQSGTRALASLAELREAGADVIHVLTPPDSHADVACAALKAGCHVLVEKPLATSVKDCQRIEAAAARAGTVASVNHSLLYDPQVVRALELVKAGRLGRVVAVDILRGSMYPPYRGGPLPPQYRAAAYPFRDLGVHALYLFQAFLGPVEDVNAMWEARGGDPNLAFDEWRALVRCRGGLGQVQLSWNVKPMQSQILVQGTKGVLRVDLFLMFQAFRAALPVPKPIERIVNALTDSTQPLIDVPVGIFRFATGAIKPFQGLHGMVQDFYRRLDEGRPPPVTIEEATSVVHWTEVVAGRAEEDHAARLSRLPPLEGAEVLVTGAAGALGSEILRRLAGRKVRVLVRRPPPDLPAGVEIVLGDLGNPEAVERAVRGVGTVVHVGAAMAGGWEAHEAGTVTGTRNVVDACSRHAVRKLVHISSMSVSDWAGTDGGVMSERTPLEPRAEDRGHYTRAKLEAEQIVSAAVAGQKLAAVILRPGQIFGGRLPLLTPAVARRVGGRWLVLGDGRIRLPLVHVEDVVDAVMVALDGPLHGGELIQLVDPDCLTQNEVLAAVLPASAKVLRVPRVLVFMAGRLSEVLLGLLRRKSPVSAYRLRSALSRMRFESEGAALLGWKPRVGTREGIRRAVAAISSSAAEPGSPTAPGPKDGIAGRPPVGQPGRA